MAYTTGATLAATAAAIIAATPTATADAVNNALTSLAAANVTPVGTPVLMWGCLVKCTTAGAGAWGAGGSGTAPAFSYDAAPA